MNQPIINWAKKHNISQDAIQDLALIFGTYPHHHEQIPAGNSEANVQARVRLEAARKGVTLWRNNVGVLLDARGVPVRYGLANDSTRLNAALKSGDLVGWRSVTITPEMLHTRIAQVVSRECKRSGWKYKGDKHEQAQLKWIEMLTAAGGDACFANDEGTL